MKINRLLFVFLSICCPLVYAFPCYFTLVKSDCWLNYDVKANVVDAQTEKVVTTVTIPKGKLWGRAAFTCQPAEKLYYTATFSPNIWTGDEKRVYRTKQFNYLPDQPSITEGAWNIEACYPKEFAELPIPPKANSTCPCDFSKVPAIKPIPSK